MEIIRIAAVGVLGTVALLLFKQYKPEWSLPLRLVLIVVLGGMILSGVREIIAYVDKLALESEGLTGGMWPIILKAFGVAFISEMAIGVCRDSGEGGLASWVETAGKLTILLLSLPLISEILDTVKMLLGVG